MYKIFCVIRQQLQASTSSHTSSQRFYQGGLNKSSLVMAFLGPGVREIHMYCIHSVFWKILTQYFVRLGKDQLHVVTLISPQPVRGESPVP